MTYAYAQRITILRAPLYNYTDENPNASRFSYRIRWPYKLYHARESIRILKDAGIFEQCRESLAEQTFRTLRDTAQAVDLETREEYFRGLQDIFLKLTEGNFEYKYFSNKNKLLVQFILHGEIDKFYDLVFMDFIMYNPEDLYEKKIVLFGAGQCGRSYAYQLSKLGIQVCCWVDNKPDATLGTVSPDVLNDLDFDVVLVAMTDNKHVQDVICQLGRMGVPQEKIIWKLPLRLG